jgi:hypothetical protein
MPAIAGDCDGTTPLETVQRSLEQDPARVRLADRPTDLEAGWDREGGIGIGDEQRLNTKPYEPTYSRQVWPYVPCQQDDGSMSALRAHQLRVAPAGHESGESLESAYRDELAKK